MVRVWANRAMGRNVQCRRHDRPHLVRFDYGRSGTWPLPPAENADRRDFVVWVLGMSEKAEVTSSVVPMASHVLRACRVAPVVDALHSGVPVTEAFSESGVLAQQSFLFRELPPQAAIQRDVSGNLRAQHDGSPGHGCAIFMSIGRSTLA